MFTWLTQNIGTIVVLLILTAIVAAIIIKLVNDKKHGKSSCGGNCSHCSMSCSCHKK